MSEHRPIFDQEWWYHAATDGAWRSSEYRDGQSVAAKLIFVERTRRGLRTIGMPNLARVMQPQIVTSARKDGERLSQSIKALKGLSDATPDCDVFSYVLPPESTLDLAYCLCGYAATARYTFRSNLDAARDPWAEMDQKVRYNIRTGSKRTGVEFHDDLDRYIRLSRLFIASRAFKDTVDYDAVLRVWSACRARNQGTILSVVNAAGRDLAGAILIWDDRFLYYWLNCRNPAATDYTANSVLIWTSIEFAGRAGLTFDIDGYATPHAGTFLSRFGLTPHRRFEISRTSGRARLKAARSSYLMERVGPGMRQRLLTVRNAVEAWRQGGDAGQPRPGDAGAGPEGRVGLR